MRRTAKSAHRAAAAGAARPARFPARPQGRRHDLSPLAASARRLSRKADPAPGALGQAAPDRVFLAQRRATARWRKLTYAQTLAQVRSIAQALLAARAFGGAPDRDPVRQRHRACAARPCRHDVGIPYAPISVPYSLMSSDFGKLKSIIEIADAGPGLRHRRQAVRARDRSGGAARRRDRRHRQSAGEPAGDAVRRSAGGGANRRGRCRARQGRPRHHREDPVHLRLDRLSQGRHQHPPHAVRQPGDDPRRPCASSATSRR